MARLRLTKARAAAAAADADADDPTALKVKVTIFALPPFLALSHEFPSGGLSVWCLHIVQPRSEAPTLPLVAMHLTLPLQSSSKLQYNLACLLKATAHSFLTSTLSLLLISTPQHTTPYSTRKCLHATETVGPVVPRAPLPPPLLLLPQTRLVRAQKLTWSILLNGSVPSSSLRSSTSCTLTPIIN